MIELGDLVKDQVSGFKGIATARHTFLQGCDRISVQPAVDKEGKLPETQAFDEPQLDIEKVAKVPPAPVVAGKTGGPMPYEDQGRDQNFKR